MASRFPFSSFPNGWFAIAYSDELTPGSVKPIKALGRDLVFEPKQTASTVNMNAKGYVEIDGAEFAKFDRKMTFKEVR